MEPSAEPVSETQPVASSRIAGFWRRLGAFAVDGLVLGTAGFPLGFVLGERLAPVGTPARLIGLVIVLPYLGLLGSEIGDGQTLGKRLFRLRVVDATGHLLSVNRSLIRAALLSSPWIFNGIRFRSMSPVVLGTLCVAGTVVFGVGGAIVGTYVLNHRTRQALHDLLVGSYVIDANGIGLRVPVTSTRRPMLASMTWIGLAAAVTTAMTIAGPRVMASEFPPVLLESISAIPGASSMQIKSVTTRRTGRSSKTLVVVLWFRGPPEETERAAQEAAAAMLRYQPDAATAPILAITVIRGWDVGIASKTTARSFVRAPTQWRAELGL
jgi:uncharacterized RDD family membrane protein YckC